MPHYFDRKSFNSLKIFQTLVQKMPLSHPLNSYKKKKITFDLRQNRLKDKFVLINAEQFCKNYTNAL